AYMYVSVFTHSALLSGRLFIIVASNWFNQCLSSDETADVTHVQTLFDSQLWFMSRLYQQTILETMRLI
ncbi:unnamed protein product, partial [Heterotrigona itama]